MKHTLHFILFFCCFVSFSTYAQLNERNLTQSKRYRFTAEHKRIQRLEIDFKNVVVDEQTRFGEAVVWADEQTANELRSEGFHLIEVMDEPLSEDWWTSYPTPQQVVDSLISLSQRNPTRSRIDTIGTSIQNRPIIAITVGDNINSPNFNNRPGIMLIGSLHGNEKPGAPLCMNYAEFLLDSSESNATASRIMAECRTLILPIANPDGYNANTRSNAAGIDLNRNYPCKTTADSVDSEDGRQPETRAIMRWSAQQKPILSLNFHTGAVVANWPYDSDFDAGAAASYPPFPDKQWYQAAADSYAFHNPPMWANNASGFTHGTVNGVTWYQAPGSLQDYHCRYQNIRHITIELHNTSTPAASWLPTMWQTNRNSILAFSSLIWQGIDFEVYNPQQLTGNVYCDVGFGTAQYQRLGTSNKFRMVLPVGNFYPRVYKPLKWSTMHTMFSQDSWVIRSQITDFGRILAERITGNNGLFQIYQTDGSQFGVNNPDNLQFSMFQEVNRPWTSYSLQDHGFYMIDTLGNVVERSWLIRENVTNGQLICIPNATGDFWDGAGFLNKVLVSHSFNDTTRHGTGDALQITTNARQSNGLSESPSGNYGNNWDRTFLFEPFSVPPFINVGMPASLLGYVDTIPLVRVSFQYRGNMEAFFDYWVVYYSIDNGLIIVADTLTGIVPDWKTFYFDIPVQAQNPPPSIRVGIQVRTDGSVTRDGFTMDDFSATTIYTYATAVNDANTGLPTEFSLISYPNPFNNETNIQVTIPIGGQVTFALYDVLGKQVKVLPDLNPPAGTYRFSLNSDTMSSGIYFLTAKQGSQIRTIKLAVLK